MPARGQEKTGYCLEPYSLNFLRGTSADPAESHPVWSNHQVFICSFPSKIPFLIHVPVQEILLCPQIIDTFGSQRCLSRQLSFHSYTNHLFLTHLSLLLLPVVGWILSSLPPAALFQVTAFLSSFFLISSLKSIFSQASSGPVLATFGPDGVLHTSNNLRTKCGL